MRHDGLRILTLLNQFLCEATMIRTKRMVSFLNRTNKRAGRAPALQELLVDQFLESTANGRAADVELHAELFLCRNLLARSPAACADLGPHLIGQLHVERRGIQIR